MLSFTSTEKILSYPIFVFNICWKAFLFASSVSISTKNGGVTRSSVTANVFREMGRHTSVGNLVTAEAEQSYIMLFFYATQ